MKQLIGSFRERAYPLLFIGVLSFGLLLLVSIEARAATTVTVDNNDKVTTVIQSSGYVQQAAVIPVVVTREVVVGDFEGWVADINYSSYQILVQDSQGRVREVVVKPETINGYRVGDYVLIRLTTGVTVITLEQENPRNFEGTIIRVDMSNSQIVVQDTNARERKVQIKQGMISSFNVDDYVRVHLMADLKEAKTIETLRDVRTLEGGIVSVDAPRSRVIVRNNDGKEDAVLIRQGQIDRYKVGDRVQIYLLPDREQVQVIRVIR